MLSRGCGGRLSGRTGEVRCSHSHAAKCSTVDLSPALTDRLVGALCGGCVSECSCKMLCTPPAFQSTLGVLLCCSHGFDLPTLVIGRKRLGILCLLVRV